jgi:hypothetical protein
MHRAFVFGKLKLNKKTALQFKSYRNNTQYKLYLTLVWLAKKTTSSKTDAPKVVKQNQKQRTFVSTA